MELDEDTTSYSTELQCVVKNDHYGSCRPTNEPVPSDWNGTIVDYNTGSPVTAEDAISGDPVVDIYEMMFILSEQVRCISIVHQFKE